MEILSNFSFHSKSKNYVKNSKIITRVRGNFFVDSLTLADTLILFCLKERFFLQHQIVEQHGVVTQRLLTYVHAGSDARYRIQTMQGNVPS